MNERIVAGVKIVFVLRMPRGVEIAPKIQIGSDGGFWTDPGTVLEIADLVHPPLNGRFAAQALGSDRHGVGKMDLADVVQALSIAGFAFGSRQCGYEQARENGDDCDGDQELDQSEC